MLRWNTAAHPQHEQFAYWREVVCAAFVSLDPVAKDDHPAFRGRVQSTALGSTMRTEVWSESQFINRREHEIRRNPVEYFFANFQRRGSCVVRQDGRETVVRAGEFSIVDTTRPYYLDFRDDWDVLSYRIPRAALLQRLRDPIAATAKRVSGHAGLGAIASEFACSLPPADEGMASQAGAVLERSLHDLIAVSLEALPEVRERSRDAQRQVLRQAVLRHVERHAADPALGPEALAAHFGISRRALYKLFEGESESIASHIRQRRLRHAADALMSGLDCSVLQAALASGFDDLSHFSRLFKRQFGASPRAWRHARRAEHALPQA